jgi:fucose permease
VEIVDTSAAQRFSKNDPLPFRILGPLLFYFAGAGIATVMLGPLLPILIERWRIQDAQAGFLFTAMFIGQFSGAWVASRNLRASIIYGAGITAAGCLAMLWAGFAAAHLGLFAIGFGLGAGLTAGNVIAGTAVRSGRARILAILNVGWSIGAIACPTLVRICGSRLFFMITAVVLGLAALVALLLPAEPNPRSTNQPSSALPLPLVPLLVFALALLLYVGIENTLGGWLPSYAVRNSALLLASSISFYYWAAEFAGRSLMALLVQRIGESRLYGTSLVLLIAAISILILVRTLGANHIVALTILCGLAIAPLYPLIVSFLLARTGSHPRLGPLFATASFGGATLPWLTGVVSTHFHGLRAGLIVPAAGSVLLLLVGGAIAEKQSNRVY